jgi:hypothetical protein
MTRDSISITYGPTGVSAPATTAAGAAAAPRWARRAAHAIPLMVLPSSLWRFLLLCGLSGLEHTSDYQPGPVEVVYVLFLSLFSEGLALLAFGLVRPWGERVPRWIPFLGGRRVPVKAAVIPAATGALLLTALCAYFFLNMWIFHIHFAPGVGQKAHNPFKAHGVALVVFLCCYIPLLAWAPLLAALTYAYYKRRTTLGDMLLADAWQSSGPSRRSRLRAAWHRAHSPAEGVSRRLRLTANAITLLVIPSSIWRITAIVFKVPLGGDLHAGRGQVPTWLPMEVYVLIVSIGSELLAFLAVGLVAGWGEVWPRWIPGLRGRRVPPLAAVIPAAIGSLILTAMWTWALATGILGKTVQLRPLPSNNPLTLHDWHSWLLLAAYLPLVLWGPLLSVLTVAYWKRHRS